MIRAAAHTLVGALLRRVQACGGFGTVLRKGEAISGAMLIQLRNRDKDLGCVERVLSGAGTYALIPVGATYSDNPTAMAQYIERRLQQDPDLWLLELDVPEAERLAAEILL